MVVFRFGSTWVEVRQVMGLRNYRSNILDRQIMGSMICSALEGFVQNIGSQEGGKE